MAFLLNSIKRGVVVLFFLIFGSNVAYSQCGAIDFYSEDSISCRPAFVQFKILNLPAGASVEWDFGNGTLAGNTSPTRLYDSASDYTIKLKVTLINNAVCELDKDKYIKVKPKPEIDVTWDKPRLCYGPDTVIFTDNSPNIKTRDYILDGLAFNDAPKVLPYYFDSSYGFKTLYVFATDSFGCRNVVSYDSAVYQYWGFDSLEVDINYGPDTLLCGPMPLKFTRDIPILQNHHFVQYKWSFESENDTLTSTVSSPNIALPEGLYSVIHTFTNFGGCSYTVSKEDWIKIYDSIDANISVDKYSVCTGEEVTFTLLNGQGGKISWDFDSVPVTIMDETANSITVGFNKIGTFGVKLRYENNICVTEKSFNNLVTVNGPNPLFSLPLTRTCTLPKRFSAINESDLTGAGSANFFWEVTKQDDESVILTSTAADSISFTINDSAYYTIKLRVSGASGCVDSLVIKDAVAMDSILPLISIEPQPGCVGQRISFKSESLQGTTGIKNDNYWEIYDKNSTNLLFSGTSDNPMVQFPDTGTYSVFLGITNSQGCYGRRFFKDTIRVGSPILNFEISDSMPCRRESVMLYSNFPRDEFESYSTRWVLQHLDTNITLYSNLDRDSQAFAINYPGTYKVRMFYRSANNQCRDTVDAPFRLRVSGTVLSLTTDDDLFGCEPRPVSWKANVLADYNYINNNSSTYKWKSESSMRAYTTFTPDVALTTDAEYKRKGSHRSRIVVEHGSGCVDSFYTRNFTVGTTANFSFSSSVRCVNTTTRIANSSLNASDFKWVIDDPDAVTLSPNDTAKNPTITVNREGDFYLTLYSIGPQGCKDTMRRLIRVIDPTPDFTSSDTIQFCAPVQNTFTPTPVWYGSEYRWYFGDGDTFVTNKATAVSHVYTRNTDSFGIDIKLIVTTPGCKDTTVKKGFIKVIGPIPEYDYSIKSGCEPLKVDFINTSHNYSRFYFDYGDGEALDSTAFDNHKYMVMDKSFNSQCYKTKLVLVDKNGCFATYEHVDDVCVLKSAEPGFKVTDTIGCEKFKVNFQNTSLYGVSFKWDFEGNGNFSPNVEYNPDYYYDAGVYQPRLVAFNVNGCSDTADLKNVRIWAQPKPVSDFSPASDSICFDYPLQFYSKASSDNKIVSHFWDFGDPANPKDTTSKINPAYSYKSPLAKLVSLVVADSNGCKDTFTRYITVIDTIPPANSGLHYVTVEDNKNILAVWEKSNAGQFDKYSFFRDETGYTKLYETFNRNDTSFLVTTGIDIDAKRYCYTTSIGDTCSIISKHSPPHCTISSKVDKSGPSRLLLNWIKYVGWENDDFWGYIIYRSDGGDFVPIDTVSYLTDSYMDFNLCDIDYCYYIEAVNQNRIWRSVSNIVCGHPDYIYPTDEIVSRRASVIDDEDIIVEWNNYTAMPNFSHYKISRQEDNKTIVESYDTTSKIFYLDENVDVQNSAYSYYINAVDLCSIDAPKSTESRSILLRNSVVNYKSFMQWEPYKEWDNGVAKYVVEKLNIIGYFEFVTELPSSSTSYEFNDIDVNDNKEVCLRVYAVRNDFQDTSYSNSSCSFPESQVFIPTAFSPNKDGLNDVFKPTAIYIINNPLDKLYAYEMEIYDRWGAKVFHTNDLYEGWDGTYQGVNCPQGTYAYKIKAVGLDGKPYDFKGTVNLIR